MKTKMMTKAKARGRSLVVPVALAAILGTTSCHRHPASAADCAAVLARLVDLELGESGYRDPVLGDRWRRELGGRFAPDLERCRGLSVPDNLATCLAAARSSKDIAHRCLE